MPGSCAMHAHDLREQMQAAMKKVFAAGNDDQRQVLRPRPVEYRSERHDFIVLAVDNQRVRRHGGRRETVHRRTDQHQPLRRWRSATTSWRMAR